MKQKVTKSAAAHRFFLFYAACVCAFAAGVIPARALDYTAVTDALGSLFGSAADANEGLTTFRSLNIPSGGKAEALGTAFTGLADDVGFFDYNPAASCLLVQTQAAVMHNAWIADSALETCAGTIRFNNLGLGAAVKCFYVPFTQYNLFGDRISGGYYSETTAILNVSYNFFSGYYFKGLAVGANIKASYRSVPDFADSKTNELLQGSGLGQSAFAVMADVGIMLRFNAAKRFASREPNLKIGIAVTNLGAAVTGFGTAGGAHIDDPLPTRIAFGISYRPIRPLTLTAEFRQPINLQNILLSQLCSGGIGVQLQVVSFFSVQAGFLIQGYNPRVSLGSMLSFKSIDVQINYTLDLTSSLNPLNRISLSAQLKLGDRGRAEQQRETDRLYAQALKLYAEGNLEMARSTLYALLVQDPSFDPAQRIIDEIEAALEMQRMIIDFQMLDTLPEQQAEQPPLPSSQ